MNVGIELRKDLLDRLTADSRVALAAACAQRQSGVYKLYALRAKSAEPDAFDAILRNIWEDTLANQLSQRELFELEQRARKLMPSLSVHYSIYQGSAECAVICLLRCIRVRMTGNSDEVILASTQAFDSIDNFLTNPIGKQPEIDISRMDSNAAIFSHPLMRAEHDRQQRDLLELQQAASDSVHASDAIDTVRRRALGDVNLFLPIIQESSHGPYTDANANRI